MPLVPLVSLALLLSVPEPRLPGRVVDVVAGDYFFQAPDTVGPGLTTLRLRARQGGHAVWLVRLPRGRTLKDLLAPAAWGGPPAWAEVLGGPGFPPPGGTANATMLLEPGEYAIVCYVRADGLGAVPHVGRGMARRLLVAETARHPRAPGGLPAPDVTVTMVDHAFRLSAPLRPGAQRARVVNAGTVGHEFKLLRVLPGHTAQESLAWTPERGTPPPDEDAGTIATLRPGASVLTTLGLRAGDYTVVCVPQLARGMARSLRVTARAAP